MSNLASWDHNVPSSELKLTTAQFAQETVNSWNQPLVRPHIQACDPRPALGKLSSKRFQLLKATIFPLEATRHLRFGPFKHGSIGHLRDTSVRNSCTMDNTSAPRGPNIPLRLQIKGERDDLDLHQSCKWTLAHCFDGQQEYPRVSLYESLANVLQS